MKMAFERLRGWAARRPAAGWVLVGLAAVAGAILGWQIRWAASLPGLESLGAFFLLVLVAGIAVVAGIIGGVLVALHRPTAGQVLLMPAVAALAAAGVGAVVAPTFRAPQIMVADLALQLTAPAVAEISGWASCETLANSDAVVQVKAVSAGYLLGERTSVTISLPAAGEADVALTRGHERAAGGERLPAYGPVAGSSVHVEADEMRRHGRLVFTGLGPLGGGPGWEMSEESVLLDGEVRWACDQALPQFSIDPQLRGTIALTGAASASLGLTGACLEEDAMADFAIDLAGKAPAQPSSGEAVSGSVLRVLDGWELTLFRPGTDDASEFALADHADFERQTDDASGLTTERLEADFALSYGTVHVVASWRCERSEGGAGG